MMLDSSQRPAGEASKWSPNSGPVGAASKPAAQDPAGQAFNISEYWRLLVKHRLVVAGLFIAAIVVGVVATLLTTPVYTASTTLQIDREAARVLNTDDTMPRDSMVSGDEFFLTQYGLLQSRSLAERTVESLGLAASDAFLVQMGVEPPAASGSAADRVRARREQAVGLIQANLSVAPVRGSRLVVVSFTSPDAALSARVVNGVAENFIQSNLDRKFESTSYARDFLENLIAETKTRLEDSERQLVAYAAQQQIINVQEGDQPGDGQSLAAADLVAINDALAQATAARVAAQARWNQARGTPPMSLAEVYQNPAVQRVTEERVRLEAEYRQKSGLYQAEHPEMQQLRARIAELERQLATLAGGIKQSIQDQYSAAVNQERTLQTRVNRLKSDVLNLRDRTVQYNILQRELDTSRTLYDGLLQRYKEVGVTGGVTTNNVAIVDRATPPGSPSSPNMMINLIIAALLGLGLGVVAALIMEALDETLATPDDVENKLHLSLLAVIPLLERGVTPQTALADPRSAFSEAYYSLRTALQFSTANGAPASLLVTSSRPAEGKSTTAYATAVNLARLGHRVLLADGDLRNPSMHRIVGVENDAGMSNLLSGGAGLSSLVKPTSQQNLDFIPCGPLPPNPAELWGGQRLHQVLAEAAAVYDHVIIDGPPVLGFADSPLLASAVTGTVFVLEAKGTRRAQARGALRRLAVGNGRILGAVLTKFNTKATQYGGYDYAYDYHYGPEAEAAKPRKAAKR
jgi:succinoglycan biosynthesis transport protein ExoP